MTADEARQAVRVVVQVDTQMKDKVYDAVLKLVEALIAEAANRKQHNVDFDAIALPTHSYLDRLIRHLNQKGFGVAKSGGFRIAIVW